MMCCPIYRLDVQLLSFPTGMLLLGLENVYIQMMTPDPVFPDHLSCLPL